jgi:DNA-binding GntR family transcriptional regulator
MLTDQYGLLLSTASSAARDAYLDGCEAKLTMYPGAIEAFDRAIAADPDFALAHAARAHALLERGGAAAARASMTTANSHTADLSAREASHIAFFDLLVAGDAEAALSALRVHLNLEGSGFEPSVPRKTHCGSAGPLLFRVNAPGQPAFCLRASRRRS